MTRSEEIIDVLRRSKEPLSVEQLCKAVFGRTGDRERGLVRVYLHRLDSQGKLVKYPRRYSLAPETSSAKAQANT